MLASLNHPHIATLHGMEQSDGRHFLVMELVEGETLADRLRRGPMPVEEAAGRRAPDCRGTGSRARKRHHPSRSEAGQRQDHAGRRGQGLGLRPGQGHGCGASARRASPNSPTLSRLATEAGIILGTAAYMSPEQAKGLPADQRSDIFSFGVVLFEMLTGRRPFQGETAAEVLASVIVRDPELASLPHDAEPANRRSGAPLPREASEAQVAGNRRRARGDRSDPRRSRGDFGDRGYRAARAGVAARDPAGRRCSCRRYADGIGDLESHAISCATGDCAILGSAAKRSSTSRKQSPDTCPFAGRIHDRLCGEREDVPSPMSGLDIYPIQGIESGEGVADMAFSPDGRALVFWARDREPQEDPCGRRSRNEDL